VARFKSSSVAKGAKARQLPTYEVTSSRRNGALLPVGLVYSPGRQRKKKARQIMLITARDSTVPCCSAIFAAWSMTPIGTGLTRSGAGSAFEYPLSWRLRRNLVLPRGVRRGSKAPMLVKACPTTHKAPSTVRDLTGLQRGAS
jgi:hypothetical protein